MKEWIFLPSMDALCHLKIVKILHLEKIDKKLFFHQLAKRNNVSK
jgi:hypothetical protein